MKKSKNEDYYHSHFRTLKRFSGHGPKRRRNSAVAAWRYITRRGRYSAAKLARDRGKDEIEERLLWSKDFYMPSWATGPRGPEKFWSMDDEFERANARLGTKLDAALPRQLPAKVWPQLIRQLCEFELLAKHPCSVAIHWTRAADSHGNPHAHFFWTDRMLDGVEREPEIFFRRSNRKHPGKGGAAKDRRWNSKFFFRQVRAEWARIQNEALKEAGFDEVVDPRSYAKRGIPKLPAAHIGPEVRARAKRQGTKLKVSPSFAMLAEDQIEIDRINSEIRELQNQQTTDLKIQMQNRKRQETASLREAAESEVQVAKIRVFRDRARIALLAGAEADEIRRRIHRALAGWSISWKPNQAGVMPIFTARSGTHQISFDGREIVGRDSSEDTWSRMVVIAKAAGRRTVEVFGNPQARRRIVELSAAAGLEVVTSQAPAKLNIGGPMPLSMPSPFDS